MSVILVYAILIFIVVFAFLMLLITTSIAWGLIATKGVPFISTPKDDWQRICEAAELKPGQLVYDLGCGKANLLTTAVKGFGVKGVGYEIALWPNIWGRLRVWRQKADVEIRAKNFMYADIEKADVVFCYLFPHVMAQLEPKFQAELKPGARVVSYAFKMPNAVPAKVMSATARYSKLTNKPIHTSNIYIYQY